MNDNEFKDLFLNFARIYELSPKTAETLLEKIIRYLKESDPDRIVWEEDRSNKPLREGDN